MINISYDIKEYRKQLFNIANDGNVIVELGCHVGNTTKQILDKFDNVRIISVDNSPEAIDKMEKLADEYSNLTFISGDVRRHEILLKAFRLAQKCDILSVDLGGGYHPDTVFKVFYIWSSTFKPTHSLIRNKGLVDFCNSASPTFILSHSSVKILNHRKAIWNLTLMKEFLLKLKNLNYGHLL